MYNNFKGSAFSAGTPLNRERRVRISNGVLRAAPARIARRTSPRKLSRLLAIIRTHVRSVGDAHYRFSFTKGLVCGRRAPVVLLAAVVATGLALPARSSAAATITYVQGNYATPQSPEVTVEIPFAAQQSAGDLNVVVVGWNDSTAEVTSVTDTSGNTYTRAVGPTINDGYVSQSIYYAKNIASAAAGANVVTVTFSKAAAYPDIRILEYSGADPNNPVDVTAASSGSSATSSSGAATTTNATDLILGANIVTSGTAGTSSGFTRRLLTSPDGDIAEDKMTTATGSYNATAPLSSSGSWVMQMIAIRTPSGDIQPPTTPGNLKAAAAGSSEINLSWTASTASAGIANYIVERCQNAGCEDFTQIATPSGTSYSDTDLASSTSYSYRVRAVDAVGNLSAFSSTASTSTPAAETSTISYEQGNYATPQAPQTSVTIPFTAAQVAGDLNVVVVGWNDTTASIRSVIDKSGNVYALAVGPTIADGLSQSIYYAKNIAAAAAGANAVTVTFSTGAIYPDIRILEYDGADPNNPVDVRAASSGSGATTSSGSATTTNATDLVFGANIVSSETAGPSSGFTQRLLTSPDGDIAEDKMTTTAASYAVSAPLSSSGSWIMQMVAFRTASGGVAPSMLSASPTTVKFGNVAVGEESSQNVTLTNTGVGGVTVSQATPSGGAFTVTGGAFPLTLAAGQSASFTVNFSPTVADDASGSVSVVSTASDSPLTIALSADAVTQTLSASPGSLSFGNITIGSSSVLPVVVTNAGSGSITVSQATASGSGFSITGPSLPLTLASGKNTSFSVTFDPSSTGSVTGLLSVVSNATNSPTAVALSGAGVNQHSVTLSWVVSTSPNITGYDVYRSTVSGGPYTKLDSTLVTGTSYTDATVEAGDTYYYVTTAVDSQGLESTDSNQATAAIPSP